MGPEVAIPETDWPTYEVPADVPRDADASPAPAAGTTPPPAATPAPSPTPAVGTPPAPAPSGGAPATPSPTGVPAAAAAEPVTANQGLEELRAQVTEQATINRTLIEQNTVLAGQLRELLTRQNQPPPAPAPAPTPEPELSEQDRAVLDRLYKLIPGLKDLPEFVAKKAALLGAAEAVPGVLSDREAAQRASDEYWAGYRDQQFTGAQDLVAKELLGDGKTAKDLDPLARHTVASALQNWVLSDPARAARYERQDQQLLGEFFAHYKAIMMAPLRRTENVAALAAAEAAPPIPRGGPSVTPSPVAPAAPTVPTDEDAIHGTSWAMHQASRRSA
jgi:hypothetical protein